MPEYYLNESGFHCLKDSESGLEIAIDKNTATITTTTGEFYTKALTVEDAKELIEEMKIPGIGFGNFLIRVLRAFDRAASGGSSAK